MLDLVSQTLSERVLTVYCEQYKLNNIIKFLKDVNITNKLGQAYRFVIRYNQNDNDLYIYDPKAIHFRVS